MVDWFYWHLLLKWFFLLSYNFNYYKFPKLYGISLSMWSVNTGSPFLGEFLLSWFSLLLYSFNLYLFWFNFLKVLKYGKWRLGGFGQILDKFQSFVWDPMSTMNLMFNLLDSMFSIQLANWTFSYKLNSLKNFNFSFFSFDGIFWLFKFLPFYKFWAHFLYPSFILDITLNFWVLLFYKLSAWLLFEFLRFLGLPMWNTNFSFLKKNFLDKLFYVYFKSQSLFFSSQIWWFRRFGLKYTWHYYHDSLLYTWKLSLKDNIKKYKVSVL